MDTGWLLVGAAGVFGGLALALVGAGVATSPVLVPLGVFVGLVAYLAWVVGSSRVVATVYEEVGDPDGSGADGRTGRRDRHDPQDPDGYWGTAADGGRTANDGGTTGPGFEHGRGSESADAGARGTGSSVDDIWDAEERDRVGGWDDWEWTDRRWREFEREYDIGQGTDGASGYRGTGTGRSGGRGTTREDGGRSGGRSRRGRGGTRDGDHGERAGRRGTGSRTTGGRSRGGAGRGSSRRGRPRTDRRAVRAREVLGVDRGADEAAVQTAYRARVKETHPDHGGDPEAFKRVQWAYEYLTEN